MSDTSDKPDFTEAGNAFAKAFVGLIEDKQAADAAEIAALSTFEEIGKAIDEQVGVLRQLWSAEGPWNWGPRSFTEMNRMQLLWTLFTNRAEKTIADLNDELAEAKARPPKPVSFD